MNKVVKKRLGKVGFKASGVNVGELPYIYANLLKLGFNDLSVIVNAEGYVVLEAKRLIRVKNLLGDLVNVEELK